MNKTIAALLRGYVAYDVNGERFLLYNSALARRKQIKGHLEFKGLHILKGWVFFYYRITRET